MEIADTFRPYSTKASLWKQVDEQSDVCDFTIKVGNWEKRFHSSIMMASPFFQCVIESKFMLCTPACIELTDTGASSAEMALMFLYGKCPKLNEENIGELFNLAEFMLIPNLKALCVKFAQFMTIRKENVTTQLKLASLYEFDHPRALEYVHSHLDDLLADDSLIPASKYFIQSLFANDSLRYVSMDTRLQFLIRWIQFKTTERKGVFQDFVALLDINQLSENIIRRAATELGAQCCANLLHSYVSLGGFKPREIIVTVPTHHSFHSRWYDIINDQWMNPYVSIDMMFTYRHANTFACALNKSSYGVCFLSNIKIVDVPTKTNKSLNLCKQRTITFKHVCANSTAVFAYSIQTVQVRKSEEQIKLEENIRDASSHGIWHLLGEVSPTATIRKLVFHIGNIDSSSDVTMEPIFTLNSNESVSVCINEMHTCAIVNKDNIILFDTLTYKMDTFANIYFIGTYQVVPLGDGFVVHDNTLAVCIHKLFGPCLKDRYSFRAFTLPQQRDIDGNIRPGRLQYRLVGNMWIRRKEDDNTVFERSLERFSLHSIADPKDFFWKPCNMPVVQGSELFSLNTTAILLRVPKEILRCHEDCPHCKALQQKRPTYETDDFEYKRIQGLWKSDGTDSDDDSFNQYDPKRNDFHDEYDNRDCYYDESGALILARAVHGVTYPRKCETKKENGYYHACVRQWQLTDKISRKYSAFLEKPHLFDEICDSRPGKSVYNVDTCVNQSVSPWCDVIVESWKAYKTQVQTICKFRHDFERLHKLCRNDTRFQQAYDECHKVYSINKNSVPACTGVQSLLGCLDNSLNVYCSRDSQRFFKMIFRASLQYHIEFLCHKYTKDVPKSVQTVSPIDASDLSTLYERYEDYNDRLDYVDNKNETRGNTQMHKVNCSEPSRDSTNGSRDHESFFRTVIVYTIFIIIR
ncbi:uncharacterized protein LOC127850608 isoform X4 [Dreissena polymorpha]|uniref:uncharacterized protein LOC127850608 isoform X2 n=1 Tax=Dreissena polymorpha TaxID=45954 RepID=UPI0022651764|nr:uncharacterized protein LOC127850608 isoform X2 [Dreissena polymorpha]XP_052239729.1 uncharacterized protein LOC127850608 isoform X3 [Dreissena polymorpha]XP_052239737.1 uncharacterized protein LOC127850608 isoform X4 [Dreissena polymorpha]